MIIEDQANRVIIVMMSQWKYVPELTHYQIYKKKKATQEVYPTELKIWYLL